MKEETKDLTRFAEAAGSGPFCVEREVDGLEVVLVVKGQYESTLEEEGGVRLARTGDVDRKPIFTIFRKSLFRAIFGTLLILLAIFRSITTQILNEKYQ